MMRSEDEMMSAVTTRHSSAGERSRARTRTGVHPIPAEDLEVELSRVQEEAQRNAIWLDRLLGVAAKLASAATVDAVTEVIVSEVFDAFGPDNGAVWLLDPTSTRLDLFRARGIPAELQQRFGSYPLITDNPLC